MKNCALAIVVLLWCTAYGVAQGNTDLAQPTDREFAFNCLPLVTSFLPYDSNPVSNINDFSLILKKRKNTSEWYKRTALKLLIDGSEGASFNSIIFKKGVENKMSLSKMWIYHYGGELFLGLNQTSRNNTRGELGVAGVYGLQCMLNERIAIGTEGYVEASLLVDDSESGFNVKLRLPRTLLFSIYF